MGRGLHVVTWSHLILLRIAKIAEGWSHTVFTPALEATTSTRTFGKLPLVNCYRLARENLVISMFRERMLLVPFGCSHPPPPAPLFLLTQNLSPKKHCMKLHHKMKVSCCLQTATSGRVFSSKTSGHEYSTTLSS